MFAKAGLTPLTIDPFKGVKADPNTVSLAALLSGAPVTVAPADTLDVKRADEFYLAAAAVIGGLEDSPGGTGRGSVSSRGSAVELSPIRHFLRWVVTAPIRPPEEAAAQEAG